MAGVDEVGGEVGVCPNDGIVKNVNRISEVSREGIAALPPHKAESLRLSGPTIFSFEATPRIPRGGALLESIPIAAGKAKPFRRVLRQSRKTKSCDNGMIKP